MLTDTQFTAFARQYLDTVYRVALNYIKSPADAEDVTQNETEPVQGQKIPYNEERQQTWENLKGPVYNSNFSVFLDEENTQLVYIFNRVLDLDEVKSVVINGIEYPAE